jgi:hypothetical protein
MSTTEDNVDIKPVSLAGWKKNAVHTILCPSGSYVKVRVPDLPALIEAGQIPQHLLDAAIGVATGQEDVKPSIDLVKQQREFTDKVVELSVVEPKLSEADLPDVPFEDKELIVAIATRQRDFDAEGSHIAGLDKSSKFRRFRGIDGGDQDVEDL